MKFADHFSGHSPDYRRFRPGYPPELFAWLAQQAPGLDLAWDAGTGNGQSALGLAAHFRQVFATDPSAEQLANAEPHARIRYVIAAEQVPELGDRGTDLVTVAQALHWFDFDPFFTEVRRVLRPGGLLAAWAYNHSRISPEIDPLVRRFQDEIVGPWWAPEREYVDRGYAQVHFPFDEIAAPPFAACHEWNARHFLEYLRTWSAVKAFLRGNGFDPVDRFAGEFLEAWGEPERNREVRFPLVFHAGRAG